MSSDDPGRVKVVATNRNARRNYTVLDTYEAGLALVGSEVKSLRNGQASLAEGFVRVEGDPRAVRGTTAACPERVDIGAHNHEVEVADGPALAAGGYRISHRDLNDGTVEGLVHASGRIASVQFHPEGAPGPIDASRVFDLALEHARG